MPKWKTQALAQRKGGDPDAALQTLTRALQQNAATAPPEELAELYGILGGTQRERGDLAASIMAYDAGFSVELHHHLPSTYNALNRLVTRVALAPESLVALKPELAEIQELLREQLQAERANDDWANGDLVLTSALVGDAASMNAALGRLVASPTYVRAAYLKTFSELARLGTVHQNLLKQVRRRLSAI